MDEILKWFTDNYTQNKAECVNILRHALKDYPFTVEQLKDGCFELRKVSFIDKDHLPTHIKLIGELCNVGIKANIAGEKLREAIIKVNKLLVMEINIETIKQRIEDLGLKKQKVAEDCGITRNYFSNILNGKRPLSDFVRDRIKKVLF